MSVAIFDIGKTNKKLFLFDEQYQIVWEKSEQLDEVPDEDGDLGEDLFRLMAWVAASLAEVVALPDVTVRAVNISAYGASFVFIDQHGHPVAPLYNYLKTYPAALWQQFLVDYGPEQELTRQTASPSLGSLNSGLQVYRLRHERPNVWANVAYALHLPQYLSYLIGGSAVSDLTSIGCHTMLWDFDRQTYHAWVSAEGVDAKLAPVVPSDTALAVNIGDASVRVGVGLHDSSAALIPYLASFNEPFVLISTGTWCVSMNPFNNSPLTPEELQYDCLNYMHYKGQAVKSSRLFAGHEHEQQTKRLAAHFHVPADYYKQVGYDPDLTATLRQQAARITTEADANRQQMISMQGSRFAGRNLTDFATYAEGYHQLMLDIMAQQLISTSLVLATNDDKELANQPVRRIFVDGGFGNNPLYMNLLAAAFPNMEVYAASVAQASALGAALAIHEHWNTGPLPTHCVELKRFINT